MKSKVAALICFFLVLQLVAVSITVDVELQVTPPKEMMIENVPIVQVTDDWIVTWTLVKQMPYAINISIQNRDSSTKKRVNLTSIFSNFLGGLDIDGFYVLENVSYTVQVPDYTCIIENRTFYDIIDFTILSKMPEVDIEEEINFVGNVSSLYISEVVTNKEVFIVGFDSSVDIDNKTVTLFWNATSISYHEKTEYRLDWESCKTRLFEKTEVEVRESYDSMNIPKLYSDLEEDGTFNGTKQFRLEFSVPMIQRGDSWGSSGRVALNVSGTVFDPWWDSSWTFCRGITIDSGDVDEVLTDFPVMVYLDSSRISWANVQDDLDDLRFIDSTNSSVFKYEIEKSNVNINATLWVKIPSVSSTPDTDFFMYYGNVGASSGEDAENVWDDNYVMVQHMVDENTTTILDSTQYDNDGTKEGANEPIEVSGMIDGAQDFDGADDVIDILDHSSLNVDAVTIEAWINLNNNATDQVIAGKDNQYYLEFKDGVLKVRLHIDGYWQTRTIGDTSLDTGLWYHVVTTFSNPNCYIYLNGSLDGSKLDYTDVLDTSINIFKIGNRVFQSLFFNGTIDEVSISNIVRSASWIKASYESGRDDLLTFGSEEELFLQIQNKSISSSVVYAYPDVEFTITSYVAEVKVGWKNVGNVTLYLHPDDEDLAYRAFNNSGTWEFLEMTDTLNHGSIDPSDSSATQFNASTVEVIFALTLSEHMTWGSIDVNMTSLGSDGVTRDSDLYYDSFIFRLEEEAGGAGIIGVIGIIGIIGIVGFMSQQRTKREGYY